MSETPNSKIEGSRFGVRCSTPGPRTSNVKLRGLESYGARFGDCASHLGDSTSAARARNPEGSRPGARPLSLGSVGLDIRASNLGPEPRRVDVLTS